MKAHIKDMLARTGLLEPIQRARWALRPDRFAGLTSDTPHIAVRKDNREIRLSPSCGDTYLTGMVDHFDIHHSSVMPKRVNGLSIVDYSRPQTHRLTRFGAEVELSFEKTFIAIREGDREIRISPSHHVYLWDMANFFDHHHSGVTPQSHDGVAVVDYSRPQVHRLTRSGLEFEFPSLPESEESTEAYLSALDLKSGDMVLDLGAYAGASTYFLARAVGPTGLVASFEPDEDTFRYLEANVARHHLDNVRIFQKGIWSETTTLAFQSEGSLGSSIVHVVGRDSNVKTVEVLSLDDAAALAGGRRLAAIKMDIEGAELEVLRNAGDFLRRRRPTLIVEVHFQRDGRQPMDEILDILRSYDYSVGFLPQGTGGDLVVARPNT